MDGTDGCTATRVYVVAGDGAPDGVFPAVAGQLRADPAWIVHEVDSGHDVMVDAPDELTKILVGVAEGAG